VQSLQDIIAERQLPLMLAQTRLEKRTERPNVELVRDPVQSVLTTEVQNIGQSQGYWSRRVRLFASRECRAASGSA
jgi:chorismate-pyruvate lyase